MFRFEKLEVWKEAVSYGKNIYQLTEGLPKNEVFGLISQLRRAAVSVSSNIAEGSGSSSNKDFSHFLDIAIKSTIETVSQLMFCVEMKYLKQTEVKNFYEQAEILIKRIQMLKKSLQ